MYTDSKKPPSSPIHWLTCSFIMLGRLTAPLMPAAMAQGRKLTYVAARAEARGTRWRTCRASGRS